MNKNKINKIILKSSKLKIKSAHYNQYSKNHNKISIFKQLAFLKIS